jgi:hypothetical protein
MDNLAVKSGMRGMERGQVGASQPDKAPGGEQAGIEGGPGEQDRPVSHFVHQDPTSGHHMLNITKLHEHLMGKSKGFKAGV